MNLRNGLPRIRHTPRAGEAIALLLAVVALNPRQGFAEPLFDAPFHSIPIGSGATWMVASDLDNDGQHDLVVVNSSTSTVAVHLGLGDGMFANETLYFVGDPGPNVDDRRTVVIADVNEDGDADLLVTNAHFNYVSVLPGNGDGTFGPKNDYPAGSGPFHMAVSDVNGDGALDLLLANHYGNSFSVSPGNSEGAFGPQIEYAAGVFPIHIAANDFNGDGVTDVVVLNEGFPPWDTPGSVTVRLGVGDGAFGPASTYLVGYPAVNSTPSSLAVHDLNSDGTLDLAIAAGGTSQMVMIPGNGDGTFAPSRQFHSQINTDPSTIAVADLNSDGAPDLVGLHLGTASIMVRLGSPIVTPYLFAAGQTFATGPHPVAIAIIDLNHDAKLDCVLAHGGIPCMSVLWGNGDGTFGIVRQYPTQWSPYGVAMGDLDRDGLPDLVVSHLGGSSIAVLKGLGTGAFGPPVIHPVGVGPLIVELADMNGDSWLDLISNSDGDHSLSIRLANGDGTFGPRMDYATGAVRPFAIGDLDGDGDLDVATAKDQISILRGNGDGTLQAPVEVGAIREPWSVAVADVSGDGALDLIVVGSDPSGPPPCPGYVSVLLGNGDATFGARSDLCAGLDPRSVAIADLNGDARPDLAVADAGSNVVAVFHGVGNGTFGAKTAIVVGSKPFDVACADFNGDGRSDVAVANRDANTASVLLGSPSGALVRTFDYGAGRGPINLAIGDVNVDGRPDIVAANVDVSLVTVLLNRSTAIPTATLLAFFGANWIGDVIEVRWQFAAGPLTTEVQRAESPEGPWAMVGVSADRSGTAQTVRDAGATPGRRWYYRLVVAEAEGGRTLFGPIEATGAASAREFAFLPVTPNPSSNSVKIRFAVPREVIARLVVVDIQGRHVATLFNGRLDRGLHTATWSGADSHGAARPGIYLARLEWQGGATQRRFALIR